MIAAAAALIALVPILYFLRPDSPLPESTDEVAIDLGSSEFFANDPSCSDIYQSPFDYPDYVWRAEISASHPGTEILDEFSASGALAHIAVSPPAEFCRLLAPIGLLPGDGNFGNYRY